MRLSKRTEYGLRAVVQLGLHWPNQLVQSRDLAKHENLPTKFLESILLALRRGGFLESKVGSGGGYWLARAPREIIVGDVIRRLEGRLGARDALKIADASPGGLAVQLINDQLTDATDEVLDSVTLEQLLEQVGRKGDAGQGMYYI